MGDGLSESEIHKAVVNQLRYRGVEGLTFWHTPNGAYHGRRPWEGAEMKRNGVLPGVSDLILVREGKCHALELKREDGKPTKAQERFLKEMAHNGWETGLAYGLDDAIELLQGWGLIK